jgi:hypothetical protein
VTAVPTVLISAHTAHDAPGCLSTPAHTLAALVALMVAVMAMSSMMLSGVKCGELVAAGGAIANTDIIALTRRTLTHNTTIAYH